MLASERALSQVRDSGSPITEAATSRYQALLAFINDVRRSCSLVEEVDNSRGSPNLISFLERLRDKTWGDIKAIPFSCVVSSCHFERA